MVDFRAEEVAGKIAPRPLLLIHAAKRSVTPTEQSIEMFKRAGQPTELHLFSGLDHFYSRRNPRGCGTCCGNGSIIISRRRNESLSSVIVREGGRSSNQ